MEEVEKVVIGKFGTNEFLITADGPQAYFVHSFLNDMLLYEAI